MTFLRSASVLGMAMVAAACSRSPLDASSSATDDAGSDAGIDTGLDAQAIDAGSDADAAGDVDAAAMPPQVGAPNHPHALAVDAHAVYFTDATSPGGAVKRYSRDDGTITSLYTAGADVRLEWPIANDAGHLYFAGYKDATGVSTLYALPLAGGAPAVLWEVPMAVLDLAVDATKLSWSGFTRVSDASDGGVDGAPSGDAAVDPVDAFRGLLMQGALAGGSPVERYREARREVASIALDDQSVVFLVTVPDEYIGADDDAKGALKRIDASDAVATLADGIAHPRGIAARGGVAFWIDRGARLTDCVNPAGTLNAIDGVGKSARSLSVFPGPTSITVGGRYVYVSSVGAFCNAPAALGAITRLTFDGLSVETVASGLLEPGALVTGSGALAFTSDERIYVVPAP